VIDVTTVPEPASATLIAVGLLALVILRFRPRRWSCVRLLICLRVVLLIAFV